MRKVNPDAKKAMKLMYSEKISLAEAWKRVKSGTKRKSKKSKKSSRRRLSKTKNSLKLNRKKMHRKSKRRSRKFGSAGPGYEGQTSYSNASAPYFGTSSPYLAASEWWAPVIGNKPQYPEMLMKN